MTWLSIILAMLNRGACWQDAGHTTTHTTRCTLY
jgi:hypothetical protein